MSEPSPTYARSAGAQPAASRIRTWFVAWTPALAIMAVIFMLSNEPSFGGPGWASAIVRRLLNEGRLLDAIAWTLPYLDKYISWAAHFIEYGVLAAALYWGIRRQWPGQRHPMLLAWLAAILYGLSDELHQSFVPGRHPDLRDIVTDAAGAAIVLLIVRRVEARRSKIKDRRLRADADL